MVTGNTKVFEDLVDFLKQKRENVTFIDIIRLAEIAASSLQSFFETFDATVYRELREIAGYIDSMRDQIGVLQVNEIKNSRIPAAGQELGAIVKATENATNTIMNCAEALMAADASDPVAYKALVDEKMMMIFEACSFQDITGQRIAKVVETLQHIEERVGRFANVMKAKDFEGFLTDSERDRAARKERLFLHGPSLDGQGVDQSTVDKMIENDDKGSQANIDKLFS
ncbi:chemotaxis protein [Xanthobacteraceae bacterium Astr-EGSB]|uniref:protein phosphatase CheZ n=1 Tax=Astrobacterium formosum TaxID=3069710 RepID=UPI0027B39062|nr:chemotaxis protein [Xanthobacteraceae bacterium Astr-EGSB]